MRLLRNFLFLALSLLGVRAEASAAFIYITQSGSPAGICTSGVKTPTFFNTSSNWGSGSTQIGAGTTVVVCGTITGSAGATGFTFQGGGSSGNPVTLLLDAGANLTSVQWGTAIYSSGNNYIAIDGGVFRTSTIQNTANGTGLANQATSVGVYVQGSNIIVQNLTIQNIYANQGSSSGATDSSGSNTTGIHADNGSSSFIIQKNTISAVSIGIDADANGTTNTISANTVSDSHWHIHCTGPGTVNIAGNSLGGWTNWQYPTGTYHTDGIFVYGVNSGAVITANIYDNNIQGDLGAGSPTGFVFCTFNPSQITSGSICNVYNNLFVTTGASANSNHNTAIWIHGASGHPMGPIKIYNDTFVGFQAGSAINTDGDTTTVFDARNNIFTGNGASTGFYYWSTGGSTFGQISNSNNNDYYEGRSPAPWQWGTGPSYYFTLSSWQSAATPAESASVVGNPNLNSSCVPVTPSSAIGLGQNLTSSGLPGITADMNGNPRPASGVWDAGAQNHPTASVAPMRPPGPVLM